jgi:UDP-N-acetylmuramyl pentapeptide phosphotransferase/UDP-N-acetylglucosamine-1-phosphate transferase
MNAGSLATLAVARLALVFGVAFGLAPVLAHLARRAGLGDAPTQARKLQREAVPTVAGLALLAALAVAPPGALELSGAGAFPWLGRELPSWSFVLALGLLYLAGAIDDRRALAAGPKLGLQALGLLPLAATRFAQGGGGALLEAGLLLFGGLVALNVLNTFDNADGAVLGVTALGALIVFPGLGAACAGVLPWNLDAARASRRAARAPTLYLGDAGVNVVALLLFARPETWPVLWIPALDIVRLAVVRWRAGSRPWIGDRRHVAHRLLATGWSAPGVALVLAALTLPGALGQALSARWPGARLLGLALGALGFLVVLLRAPAAPVREGR